jgi:hypothetical protein
VVIIGADEHPAASSGADGASAIATNPMATAAAEMIIPDDQEVRVYGCTQPTVDTRMHPVYPFVFPEHPSTRFSSSAFVSSLVCTVVAADMTTLPAVEALAAVALQTGPLHKATTMCWSAYLWLSCACVPHKAAIFWHGMHTCKHSCYIVIATTVWSY